MLFWPIFGFFVFFMDFWISKIFKIFFSIFLAKKALDKGQSPPQELEVGPHSRPYLLVRNNSGAKPLTLCLEINQSNLGTKIAVLYSLPVLYD